MHRFQAKKSSMFAWYCHVDKFSRTNIACLLWVARWPSLFTMHITQLATRNLAYLNQKWKVQAVVMFAGSGISHEAQICQVVI